MCENAIFLNIDLYLTMKNFLLRSYKLIGNLIKNRPSLYSYIMKYKGYCPDSYQNFGNINLRKYFEAFDTSYKFNPLHTRRNILRIIEYDLMSSKSNNTDPELYHVITNFRRKRGFLRKSQMLLLYTYDKISLDNNK